MIKASLICVVASLALSVSVVAIAEPGPYATEACKTGCVFLDKHPGTIYIGLVPKSYRICAGRYSSATVHVNDTPVRINSGFCADVNGTSIVLMEGEVFYGLQPG